MKFLLLCLLAFIVIPIKADGVKIGYIDTELVLNNFSLFQQENIELSKEFETKKKELLNLFNHIEILRKNLPEVANTSSSEIYRQKIINLTELEESFKFETEKFQSSMNNKKIKILLKMEKIINSAIKKLAIDEKYDLILYENAAFVSDQLDISNIILLKIEKKSK